MLVPHPRENTELFGHEKAETTLRQAFFNGHIAHAWLITGVKGIGKATLAYRFAREVLGGDIASSQIARNAHPNLKIVECAEGETEITIDAIREVEHFLRLTASDGSWRIIIIDSADEMNRNAANALLKILEEPPTQTILLLVSHAPGSLLPTVRSRCRILPLMPLNEEQGIQVIENIALDLKGAEMTFALALSGGSPGLALQLCEGQALELYRKIMAALTDSPRIDMAALHSLAVSVGGKDNIAAWRTFAYIMTWLLARSVSHGAGIKQSREWIEKESAILARLNTQYPVDQLAEMWEKLNRSISESEHFNLDRSVTALTMLHALH